MILDKEIDLAIKAAKASGKLLLDNKKDLNSKTSQSLRDIKLKSSGGRLFGL